MEDVFPIFLSVDRGLRFGPDLRDHGWQLSIGKDGGEATLTVVEWSNEDTEPIGRFSSHLDREASERLRKICESLPGQLPPPREDLPAVSFVHLRLGNGRDYKFTTADSGAMSVMFEIFAAHQQLMPLFLNSPIAAIEVLVRLESDGPKIVVRNAGTQPVAYLDPRPWPGETERECGALLKVAVELDGASPNSWRWVSHQLQPRLEIAQSFRRLGPQEEHVYALESMVLPASKGVMRAVWWNSAAGERRDGVEHVRGRAWSHLLFLDEVKK